MSFTKKDEDFNSISNNRLRNKEHKVDALAIGAEEATRQAAKSCGKVQTTCDPQISEWGNPRAVMRTHRKVNP